MTRPPILLLTALAVALTCDAPAHAVREVGTPRSDVLVGSHGRDVLIGNGGADEILGLRGIDTLVGGRGNDTITGEGRDRISGGSGNDTITLEQPLPGVKVRCGRGVDKLTLDQTGQTVRLARRSLLRRVSGCEQITLVTGITTVTPSTTDGGAPAPAQPTAEISASPYPDLNSSVKVFGVTHATGGGAAGLRALRSIGVQADRVEFSPRMSWREIDEKYTLALREGMRILPVLNSLERISGIDPDGFANWTGAFAARYGPGGAFWSGRPDAGLALAHIEIFNEPYGAWYYRPVEPAAFARLYVKAVDAGRRANATTRYILPVQPTIDEGGASRPWTAELFAAVPDIATRVDGLGVHPYGSWAVGANPLWSYWKTRQLYDDWSRRGVARPVWITEAGQCTSAEAPNCVTEQQQAEAVRFYVSDVRATPWIKALFVYTHRDAPGDPTNRENSFGLVRTDLSPKPAFWAYRDALAAG